MPGRHANVDNEKKHASALGTFTRPEDLGRRRVLVQEGHPSARLPEELLAVVEGASLPKRVKERSVRTLRRLVDVEAGIHGVDTDQVHLHELGSADTLVDVVGTFTLVNILGIDEVVTARVPLGSGYVATDHGELPVPAPAT